MCEQELGFNYNHDGSSEQTLTATNMQTGALYNMQTPPCVLLLLFKLILRRRFLTDPVDSLPLAKPVRPSLQMPLVGELFREEVQSWQLPPGEDVLPHLNTAMPAY